MSSYYCLNDKSTSKESIDKYEKEFSKYIYNTPTLKEALKQMFTSSGASSIDSNHMINQILKTVNNHLDKKFNNIKLKYRKITLEDAQIISSFTCQLYDKYLNYSPYRILNTNLSSQERGKGISNISKYLFIFLKSLRKLDRFYPKKDSKILYRCINKHVDYQYNRYDNIAIGKTMILWSFTSTSQNPSEAFNFLGKDKEIKTGTLFSYSGNNWGYDINLFNVFNEHEILLEPERVIQIKSIEPELNKIIRVRCKILDSPLVLVKLTTIKSEGMKINKSMTNFFSNNNNFFNGSYEQKIDNLNINQLINDKNKIKNDSLYEEKKIRMKKKIMDYFIILAKLIFLTKIFMIIIYLKIIIVKIFLIVMFLWKMRKKWKI
jgi:hypothetical protein